MKIYENGIYRDMTPEEVKEFESMQPLEVTQEPDRLTQLELAVAELGAIVLGGAANG